MAIAESQSAPVSFVTSRTETAAIADVLQAATSYNVSTSDTMAVTSTETSRLLWELIDDSQTPNWQNIDNTDTPSWALIPTV
jgi:hypothetical protein